MFLSLITKITGDSQATTLLGSGRGMLVYILLGAGRGMLVYIFLLGAGLGMLVIPLTWGWAWHARLHLTWVWAWHVRHRPLEASGISLSIRAAKPKA